MITVRRIRTMQVKRHQNRLVMGTAIENAISANVSISDLTFYFPLSGIFINKMSQ